MIRDAFATCLTNAPNPPEADALLSQTTSLQDSSLITTVQAEPEIPTLNNDLQNQIINTAPENSIPNTDLQNQTINTA